MRPTEEELAEPASPDRGLYGSFRFWVVLYVLAFVAVFVVF